MTDRELKKLSRADLLELFLEQLKENEQLRAQLEEAQEELAERKIQIDQAGSIAQAALQLNGVFQAADAACAQYMDNIEQLSGRQAQICSEMERKTQEKCDQMVAYARAQAQTYLDEVSRRLQKISGCDAALKVLQKPL